MIEFRDIGLDVNERRAVDHIDLSDIDAVLLHSQQANRGKPEVIGPRRRAGREDAMFGVVEKRSDRELGRCSAMELIDEPEALEALDVG